MATTPTSLINRLMGLEAWTDLATIPVRPPIVVVPPATTTLALTSALHAWRMINIASTGGLAITPPAATGTLDIYEFYVTASVTGGSFTIDAKAGNATDVFSGVAIQNKLGTGITTTPTASNTNLLTFNGGTTGGITGDIITMQDVATHNWTLFINGQYTGTFATPFSNH
jgi:hypothetical protein